MGAGMGSMALGMMTPQQQQQLLAQLQQASQSQQGGPQQLQRGGGQQQQMQPPAQPQQARVQLPSGAAQPGVPGVPMSATPQRPQGGMRASGVAAIPGAVFAVKQKMTQDKVQKARAIAGQYIALKQSNDPKIQQAADQLMADPKNHKIFAKAISDPASPEYQGVQMAYRDLQDQEKQKQAYQEMQAKVQAEQARTQAEQARVQQEQAHAALYQRQMEQSGKVTPRVSAEIMQRELAQKDANKRIQMQVDGRLKAVQAQTDAMVRVAQIRADAYKEAARSKPAAGKQDKTLDHIAKEYTNLNSQIKTLADQNKTLQKDLSDHPVTNWFSDDAAAKKAQIDKNMMQMQMLTQQLKMVEQKRQLMLKIGVLPAGVGNAGTQDEPIIISPEDLDSAYPDESDETQDTQSGGNQ